MVIDPVHEEGDSDAAIRCKRDDREENETKPSDHAAERTVKGHKSNITYSSWMPAVIRTSSMLSTSYPSNTFNMSLFAC